MSAFTFHSRVFISYVREDEEVAKRLYEDLKKQGADPWIDKCDLIPGEGWRGAIKQAVRRSSHFIAVISRNSARKRGYAQREIREALEMLKEIPPDEIYLIPARLDNTTPPYEQLQDIHYVDLFPDYGAGLRQILKALRESGGLPAAKSRESQFSDPDAEKIQAYRVLFERDAFQLPCIFEYAILEVETAVENISAAMVSGRVYSRDGHLLWEIPPISSFETPSYLSALEELRGALPGLRRTVSALLNVLCKAAGIKRTAFRKEFHDMEFFLRRLSREGVREALDLMDRVDSERNGILKQMNRLLEKGQSKVLPYITLSSAQVRLSAELEEGKGHGSQRWHDFYLFSHRKLSELLDQTKSSDGLHKRKRAVLKMEIVQVLRDFFGVPEEETLSIFSGSTSLDDFVNRVVKATPMKSVRQYTGTTSFSRVDPEKALTDWRSSPDIVTHINHARELLRKPPFDFLQPLEKRPVRKRKKR